MPCYKPKRVVTDADGHLDWKQDPSWLPLPPGSSVVLVPCRSCIGCGLSSQREWAIRGFHESLYQNTIWRDPVQRTSTKLPNSCCVTLTYDDEHLPENHALSKTDLQKFFKRLRNRRDSGAVRHLSAGEYGGKTSRPHYHSVLFGEFFSDRYTTTTSDGQELTHSHELDEIWGMGRATIDDASFGAICYAAGYCAKKAVAERQLTGPIEELTNPETGETRYVAIAPEFRTMSKKPGLAREYIEDHYERIYEKGYCEVQGRKFAIPSYYDRWLRKNHPDLHVQVKEQRLPGRVEMQLEWTPERIAAAETIASQKVRTDSL